MTIALSQLHEATLDEDTIDALFADLATRTEVDQVLVKGGSMANAGTAPSLSDARSALVSGAALGVQIRYRWQERWWIDTLMRTPVGIRIVRTAVPG